MDELRDSKLVLISFVLIQCRLMPNYNSSFLVMFLSFVIFISVTDETIGTQDSKVTQ